MAESSFAWVSVVVKWGCTTVIPRKVIKIGWENIFAEILTTIDATMTDSTISKVCISPNESFMDPVHEVEVTAPLSVCNLFNCWFVCIYLDDVAAAPTGPSKLLI